LEGSKHGKCSSSLMGAVEYLRMHESSYILLLKTALPKPCAWSSSSLEPRDSN
jgi:hypothetical protein